MIELFQILLLDTLRNDLFSLTFEGWIMQFCLKCMKFQSHLILCSVSHTNGYIFYANCNDALHFRGECMIPVLQVEFQNNPYM